MLRGPPSRGRTSCSAVYTGAFFYTFAPRNLGSSSGNGHDAPFMLALFCIPRTERARCFEWSCGGTGSDCGMPLTEARCGPLAMSTGGEQGPNYRAVSRPELPA